MGSNRNAAASPIVEVETRLAGRDESLQVTGVDAFALARTTPALLPRASDPSDRFAMLAPLAAVLLFFTAIAATLAYLRIEEIDREHEAVQRDVEYTQQRLRLRLLERQEQFMRLARDISEH